MKNVKILEHAPNYFSRKSADAIHAEKPNLTSGDDQILTSTKIIFIRISKLCRLNEVLRSS